MSTDQKTSPTAAELAAIEKTAAKERAKQRKSFELHVSLIERTMGVATATARTVAYLEGPGGLTRRLNP